MSHLCGVDVCEMFSPPRVGLEATLFGLKAGEALDLTTGWGFKLEAHRRAAEAYVVEKEPSEDEKIYCREFFFSSP